MKRTRSVIFSRQGLAVFFRRNQRLLLVFFCYLLGLLVGVVLIRNADDAFRQTVSSFFTSFVTQRSGKNFFSVLLSSFFSLLPYVLCAYLCGACIVGFLLIPFIPMIKGMGTGMLTGFLYATHALKGIMFSTILILPTALINAFLLILACRESICFSSILADCSFRKREREVNLSGDFKLYCLRFLFVLALALLASSIDALLSVCFIKYFVF